MITKRKMIVPIFDYKLTVIIFDDWDELYGLIPDDVFDDSSKALTISRKGASLVAVDVKHAPSVVHEAEHVKNHLWEYIGYIPQRDNDEVDAYLLTYLYKKMMNVYDIHIKGKR